MTAVALRVERLGDAEYVCAGRGRAMGLAHGASGDVDANFSPLLDALGDRWSFVGSRYPGTGGSGPLDDLPSVLRPEVLADRLVEALDAEGHQRVPVAGVSFGCSVAIQAALRHPDRVSALVLTVGFARPDVQLRQMLGTWEQLAGGPPERLGAFVLPATTRELAAGIPGAELLEYPAAGHAFTAKEGVVWARDVEAFLSRVDDRPAAL